MVCVSVLEVNPQALTSGLSSVQTQHHTITCLLHQHAFALCALRNIIFVIKHLNINARCNNDK